MFNYDTQTIAIDADPNTVHRFISDGTNLPRWAIGFAKDVARQGERWVVSTGSGDRIPTDIVVDPDAGTVDFVMSPGSGATNTAWSRVVPVEGGALFSFTQQQSPGMDDDVFAAQVRALSHELVALKALLEVECPL